MKRKLPPDGEVWALHASGLTYAQIADRFGTSGSAVSNAMDRWRGKALTAPNAIKSTTPDGTFIRAGAQPVAHRDTGDGMNAATVSEQTVFKRERLQIHECRDLLREWGVRS